jgi:hypothetical protein
MLPGNARKKSVTVLGCGCPAAETTKMRVKRVVITIDFASRYAAAENEMDFLHGCLRSCGMPLVIAMIPKGPPEAQ